MTSHPDPISINFLLRPNLIHQITDKTTYFNDIHSSAQVHNSTISLNLIKKKLPSLNTAYEANIQKGYQIIPPQREKRALCQARTYSGSHCSQGRSSANVYKCGLVAKPPLQHQNIGLDPINNRSPSTLYVYV